MTVYHWSEIESVYNIRKYAKSHPEILNNNSKVSYKCKVKLHGSNAAVQCHSDGNIIAQSRTVELVDGNDNAGFAKWVKENETVWQQAAKDYIFYGEWIGKGIQKGVACSEIPNKSFAVFAARSVKDDNCLVIEPGELTKLLGSVPDTYVIPWFATVNDKFHDGRVYDNLITQFLIDWNKDANELQLEIDLINQCVAQVEAKDPWIEEIFKIKGTGEGLVFYPVSPEHLGLANFNNLVFKAKGEKHKNIKTAAPAQLDASAASGISQFVDMVLTEARLDQGARAVGGFDLTLGTTNFDVKLVGKFIAWIAADVEKETQDELEASNLTWKEVSKSVGNKARTWYLANSNKI